MLVAITALVYRFRERRYLVVGWLLVLVALLPVIGILQVGVQSMADRYAYLPTIGIFIAVVWTLGDFVSQRRIAAAIPAALASIAIVAFAAITVTTEHYWYDSLTLFTRAEQAAHAPNSYIETNLAAALLDHQRQAEALTHFRKAEQLAPSDFVPHYNVGYLLARALNSLGITYMTLGDYRQAADAFQQLLIIQPNNAKARAFLDMLRGSSNPLP